MGREEADWLAMRITACIEKASFPASEIEYVPMPSQHGRTKYHSYSD
jgi:hypothetical protein